MKRSTVLTSVASLFIVAASGSAQAQDQEFMSPATLEYPSGYYVSMAPGNVDITWNNQMIEFTDPDVDDLGDEYAVCEVLLGEEKYEVNAYIMSSFGNPDDPEDLDLWQLEIALYDLDELWDFVGDRIVVYVPEGIVKNSEGLLNPAQELTFEILETYVDYTLSVESGSTLSGSDLVVTVDFGGNVLEYLQSQVEAITYDPAYKVTPLIFGENVEITDANLLQINLAALESGEYEIVIPEGLVSVTVDGEKYICPDIWLEYTVENEQSGITSVSTDNNRFDVYTIDGMRLKASSTKDMTPGLYIINGKKVILK